MFLNFKYNFLYSNSLENTIEKFSQGESISRSKQEICFRFKISSEYVVKQLQNIKK